MNNLGRYFFCFKFYANGPFEKIPYALGIENEEGTRSYETLLLDGLKHSTEDTLPQNIINEYLDRKVKARSHNQVAADMLDFIIPEEEIQLWSFSDKHCRHFFAELFGGMDQNNSYGIFNTQSGGVIKRVLPRDMNHLYTGLCKPALPSKPANFETSALANARWERHVFETLKDESKIWKVNTTATTDTPSDMQRIFYDWEYCRIAPNVLLPISLGATTQDGSLTLHVAFDEYIAQIPDSARHEFLRAAVLPKLDGVERVSPSEAALRLVEMMGNKPYVQLWSDDDNHDRHLVSCLEADGKSFARMVYEAGHEEILFRDTKHLRFHMGWPDLPLREESLSHGALYDAEYSLNTFKSLNAIAVKEGITPETIVPPDFTPTGFAHSRDHALSLLHHEL